MINFFKNLIFKEQSNKYNKVFYLVQSLYLIGLLLFAGIILVCIDDPIYVYATIAMAFLVFTTIIDTYKNGSIRKCALIVSVVTNVIYLPVCFYGFGKMICCVPVYFVLGILYTVFLVGGTIGAAVAIGESLYMCAVIMIIGRSLPGFLINTATDLDYIAIGVSVFVVIVFSVWAIYYRLSVYDSEYESMQRAHLSVIDAYNSKDIFFANTSHEIRTPLNAIVGTVNLLLDEDLDLQVKENVYSILNSCNALLSITDELMELSNTENGDVRLNAEKYNFSETIVEIVNMIAVRLVESDVSFFVDIDTSVPKYLYGDGGKVRQIFINVLNNAVKYTKSGRIILRVYSQRNENGVLELVVEVEDTGLGIKTEAQSKIFSDYRRDEEDEEKRGIEGTGLGLSFCKDMLERMGGRISVESEYHVGSTFTFVIPQNIEYTDPVAEISDSSNMSVIIFEKNNELSENTQKVLSKLSVSSTIVHDRMEFEDAVLNGQHNYLFIAAERYEENRRFIDRRLDSVRIVLLTDISQSVQIDRNCYMLTRPLYSISAVMAFNNENTVFAREFIQNGGFTCPDTTMLVVDDNLTNLEVASGLLKRYKASIHTAVSGQECLRLLENTHIDVIFLDYMMPEMNGIDTLYKIRQLDIDNAKDIPVVALTANVTSGAREMFLSAGFSGYISKPIDVHVLEKTLRTLLPREQIRIKI